MSAWFIGTLAALGTLALGVCSDMISEEIRTRLDRLPQAIIGLAVLRLPKEIRDEARHDWLADLDIFLHGDEAVPVTRLVKGTGFAVGLLLSASKVGKEMGSVGRLSAHTPEAEDTVPEPPMRVRAVRPIPLTPEILDLIHLPEDHHKTYVLTHQTGSGKTHTMIQMARHSHIWGKEKKRNVTAPVPWVKTLIELSDREQHQQKRWWES